MTATLDHRRTGTILAVVFALLALFGLQAVSPQRAEAREPHVCGSNCNGKLPTARVLLQDGRTLVCAASAIAVEGPIYPFYPVEAPNSYTDVNMLVYHMYSTECATTWLSVRNTRAIGRSYCSMYEARYKAPTYRADGACPAAGHTSVTPMVNDYMPDNSSVAQGKLSEAVGVNYPVALTAPY